MNRLKIVLEGFFPRVDADAEVIRQRHTGLQEFGLAFEADPAVTRHLSEFLRRQLPAILKRSSGDAPDSAIATASAEASTTTNHLAILFNGWCLQCVTMSRPFAGRDSAMAGTRNRAEQT